MFVPHPGALHAERAAQQSRGYVLGLILLIMFLSSQDFAPSRHRRVQHAAAAHEGASKHREDVKEKVRRGSPAAREEDVTSSVRRG